MNEKQFKECSVVAYPHEIIFLHIKGGRISYYVDRHVSDYVNKLQQENEKLKEQIKQRDNIINKTIKEINYLESNCDISNIHAQKIKQILSEGE